MTRWSFLCSYYN